MSKPKAPKPLAGQDNNTSGTLKTKPLGEFKPITAPIEIEPEAGVSEQEQESFTSEQGQDPYISAPKPEFSAPPPPFEPLESFAPLSPAVNALALAANQNTQSGNIDAAAATIERAIRIEPRNATLYYKLALLRLKQSKPRLAEDLAKKAALLASNDTQLKKHSWLLVARAREMQGDLKGGKAARAKAEQF
ncbi:MAG: tetratricopeptide repeat protein [Gammaproteobacteria bacterium]